MPDRAAIVAVSGVASAIGLAIARRFATDGARVFGCDLDAAGLDKAQQAGIETKPVDLANRSQARGWMGRVAAANGGRVDVLVNNCGGVAGQSFTPFDTVVDASWDQVMAINVNAAAALSQAAIGAMREAGGGAIINIASGASLRASMTGVQAYCAAKHALLGLTRQLSRELGPANIRVNAVAPGFIITGPATRRQWDAYDQGERDAIIRGTALRRLGTPEEIADVVAFLASPSARFITGQILSVDGGR